MTYFTFTQSDYSDEKTSCSLRLEQMTAANHDAVSAGAGALHAALAGVSRGRVRDTALAHSRIRHSNLPGAVDAEAQREEKILIVYEDTVTLKPYRIEVGCADIANLTRYQDSDGVDLADGAIMAALVTAMETHGRSEVGNTIQVVRAVLVGRNI